MDVLESATKGPAYSPSGADEHGGQMELGNPMDDVIDRLSLKIDALSAQVEYLTEQAQREEQSRANRAELVRDLTPVLSDAYRLTTEQFEEVQEYVDLSDIVRLFKRVLRNVRTLESMLDQLESAMDLFQTVGPLSDDAFAKAVDLLGQAERKGYFKFAKGGMQIADNLVASLDEDDMKQVGNSMLPMLKMAMKLTRPQVITFAQNTIGRAEAELQKPLNTSLVGLAGQMSDPAVRRGLALTLRVLHAVGEEAAHIGNGKEALDK
jgi:uncharacterized protein YjgD (DUF1641 family)